MNRIGLIGMDVKDLYCKINKWNVILEKLTNQTGETLREGSDRE